MGGEPVKRLAENAVLESREPRKTVAPERGRGGLEPDFGATPCTPNPLHALQPLRFVFSVDGGILANPTVVANNVRGPPLRQDSFCTC